MNFEKCKICREAFRSYGGRICPDCLNQIEMDFLTIRDYIDDHPGHIDAEEIAEKTGVSTAIVIHLINEGRLFTSGLSDGVIFGKCKVCGKSLPSGAICSSCNAALTAGLGDVLNPKPTQATKYAKMHIRQKD